MKITAPNFFWPWWVVIFTIVIRLLFSKPDLKEKVCNKIDQLNADKGLDKSIELEDIYREVVKLFISRFLISKTTYRDTLKLIISNTRST